MRARRRTREAASRREGSLQALQLAATMPPRRALAWCCALALAHGSQSVTKLLPSSTAELRTALYGGECWLIGCIDMGDGISAKLMADTAKLLAPDECRVATLKCQGALPSGQTTLERLGIAARAKQPAILLAVNGDKAAAVPPANYARPREGAAGGKSKSEPAPEAPRTPGPRAPRARRTPSRRRGVRANRHRHCVVVPPCRAEALELAQAEARRAPAHGARRAADASKPTSRCAARCPRRRTTRACACSTPEARARRRGRAPDRRARGRPLGRRGRRRPEPRRRVAAAARSSTRPRTRRRPPPPTPAPPATPRRRERDRRRAGAPRPRALEAKRLTPRRSRARRRRTRPGPRARPARRGGSPTGKRRKRERARALCTRAVCVTRSRAAALLSWRAAAPRLLADALGFPTPGHARDGRARRGGRSSSCGERGRQAAQQIGARAYRGAWSARSARGSTSASAAPRDRRARGGPTTVMLPQKMRPSSKSRRRGGCRKAAKVRRGGRQAGAAAPQEGPKRGARPRAQKAAEESRPRSARRASARRATHGRRGGRSVRRGRPGRGDVGADDADGAYDDDGATDDGNGRKRRVA